MTKQEILSEIRRLAAADGSPPGKKRFYNETGVRESAWAGRYWTRWGDALREAGVAANVLNGRIPDDALLSQFVVLTRRLGRCPTNRDLLLERHRDKSFASAKVFDRWGSKTARIAQVRAYCEGRPGYEDVLALLPAPSRPERAPREAVKATDGYVYLLKLGAHYKIGRTNAVGRREYELAIQLPKRPTKVHEIRTDDPAGIEAYWHARFADKRANGEWFALDADDVRAFRRRRFM